MFHRIAGSTVVVLVFLFTCTGCNSSDGPQRYRVYGTVTFAGQPVPQGRVIFEPDAAKGNKGPQGFARIEDGRYDTASGGGAIGGPHIATITGLDGKPLSDDAPRGSLLFPPYSKNIDLPSETAEINFDVPQTPPGK